MNAGRIALFVAVALALAVTANLVLLRIANGPRDPVGRLTPQAGLVRLPATQPPTTTTTAPTRTSPPPPARSTHDGEGSGSRRQDD